MDTATIYQGQAENTQEAASRARALVDAVKSGNAKAESVAKAARDFFHIVGYSEEALKALFACAQAENLFQSSSDAGFKSLEQAQRRFYKAEFSLEDGWLKENAPQRFSAAGKTQKVKAGGFLVSKHFVVSFKPDDFVREETSDDFKLAEDFAKLAKRILAMPLQSKNKTTFCEGAKHFAETLKEKVEDFKALEILEAAQNALEDSAKLSEDFFSRS